MATKRIIKVPETKSDFSIVGKVTGIQKDWFYKNGISSSGKSYRNLKFGVEYENGKTIQVSLNGFPKDDVYFYKKAEKGELKGSTAKVPWEKRMSYKQEGYNLLGISCGLEKNEETNKNVIKTLTEFDACEYISNQLNVLGDNTMVHIIGKIVYSQYTNKKSEVVDKVDFEIQRIYLSKNEVKEDEITEGKNHFFHQMTVIKEITQDKNQEDKNGRFFIDGYVIGYSSVEEVRFYTRNAKLASTLRKVSKKDYIGVQLYGKLDIMKQETVVKETDEWGDEDESKVTNDYSQVEMYVTGAEKETLDNTNFTKDKIEEAIEDIKNNNKATNEFNGKDNKKNDDILQVADEDADDAFDDWA